MTTIPNTRALNTTNLFPFQILKLPNVPANSIQPHVFNSNPNLMFLSGTETFLRTNGQQLLAPKPPAQQILTTLSQKIKERSNTRLRKRVKRSRIRLFTNPNESSSSVTTTTSSSIKKKAPNNIIESSSENSIDLMDTIRMIFQTEQWYSMATGKTNVQKTMVNQARTFLQNSYSPRSLPRTRIIPLLRMNRQFDDNSNVTIINKTIKEENE